MDFRIWMPAAVLAFSAQAVLSSEGFPARPIRVVVPIAPGGGMDTIARITSIKLSEAYKQQVVVDNRAGGGGVIGSQIVAKSGADGHTLLFVANPFTTTPALSAQPPYDPQKDFAPISMIATAPLLVVLHPSIPAKTIPELITFAKAKPNFLSYGTSGNGSPQHIAGELFKTMAGIEYTHIPYKGGAAALVDIIGGKVPLAFAGVMTVLQHVKAGRLNALAMTSAKRSPALPEVPTVAEGGVKGFEVLTWYAMFAPAGTPTATVRTLNETIGRALASPDVVERLTREAHDPAPTTPAQLGAFVQAEVEKARRLAKSASMKID